MKPLVGIRLNGLVGTEVTLYGKNFSTKGVLMKKNNSYTISNGVSVFHFRVSEVDFIYKSNEIFLI